jgi:parallel beta-helix repeat protein
MAVNLSPYGGVGAQFLDNSGNVLTGGKIFTYAAGTTTPQITYTTSVGDIPHSNPIILDASGRVPSGGEIWLIDGLGYKFILRDANDVLIATYDNVTGINSNFVAFTNQQEIQTATAGQTVFNLATITYQPATNSLTVFVDGVNQYGPGAQYAYLETDSDTVTFVNGLHVGASVKFTTSQLNSSASQSDAFQVSYTPPFTGSVGTNVGDKLAQTVNVLDFGADPTSLTDSSIAFDNAIAYLFSIGGGTLIASGSFRLNSQVDLLSNVYCDFRNATFYKGATFDYLFKALNQSNIEIYGGNYLQAVYTPLVSMLTGDYSNGLPLGFITCTQIKVIGGVFEKYYGGINVYDCSDVVIDGTYHNEGNAGIALITTNIATQNSSRIWLINNDIIGCGDDGIAVGSVNSTFDITHCIISNNYIDKARLSTGPTGAAVGIRTGGGFILGSGRVLFATISDNIITETTEEGLFLTQLAYSTVTNNIISNFSFFQSRPAIALGSAGAGCDNVVVSGNLFVAPGVNKGFGISAQEVTNSRIINNTFEANDPTTPPILLENSSYIIFNENRIFTSAAVSFVYTNVTSNITFANNFLSGIGTAPGIVGSGNKIYANNGYVTENNGLSSSISTGGTIAHGLAGTPAIISVIALGAPGPSGVAVSGIGATTFAVNWSGGGSYQFYWSAKLAGSF